MQCFSKDSNEIKYLLTVIDLFYKYFTANSTRKYIDVLDTVVEQYNNIVYPSIKMTPVEANRKEKRDKVCRNLH